MKKIIITEDFKIIIYPKKNTVWIEKKNGEGMELNLDKLWKNF